MLERLKYGLRGFSVSAAPLLVIFLLAYAAAELAVDWAYPQEDAENRWCLILGARSGTRAYGELLAIVLGLHWSLSALLGKGDVRRVRRANAILALGCLRVLGHFAANYLQWADIHCDPFAQPHVGFQPDRIYECPSSTIFFNYLSLTAMGLFLLATVWRIARSWLVAPSLKRQD